MTHLESAMNPSTGDFLARLVRLDPQSLVRVRGTQLWSRVPWNALVTRPATIESDDRTVRAADWLALGTDDPSTLERLDAQWRAGMPGNALVVRETLPVAVVRRMSEAAAETLRETEATGLRGRAVGARVLRDALLDHVPITVAADADHPTDVQVPQRLVQALVRMGFAVDGPDDQTARIVTSGPWIGIATVRGAAWWRGPSGLVVNAGLHAHRA